MSAACPAAAIASSPDIAARIRGSSCAASATTSIQPGSARDRAAHLVRQLQRSAAVRGPPPGDHAARHVDGPEPAAGHPVVEPVPAVGGQQPRHLLVLQQRGDRRVVDLLELPRAGRGRGQPGQAHRPQQLDGGVRVDLAHPEGSADLRGLRLEERRAEAGSRTGPEELGEQTVVLDDVPRNPREGHLCCDERPGRLGGEQQPQPGRLRTAVLADCCREGALLIAQLSQRVERDGRGEVEEAFGGGRRPRLVPG